MKKLLFIGLTLFPLKAFANPACAVCTVAIGASLEIARKLGVPDSVVGLWAGALLALLGYWTILFFDKKNWHFKGRDFLLISLSVATIGFIYAGQTPYLPKAIGYVFYMDAILFSAVVGVLTYVLSQKLYQVLKERNGGHAHFPFEKVVLPLAMLFAGSVYYSYFPL